MDINEIEDAIYRLENRETTFDNCHKLASLYTIRNNYITEEDVGEEILPSYKCYCEAKRNYQMGLDSSPQNININIRTVCKEIKEFLEKLFSGTDLPEERECIANTIREFIDTIE